LTDHKKVVGDKQIAQAFSIKCSDICKDTGVICLLMPSKGFLFNRSKKSSQYRKSFFETNTVFAIINFSIYRKFLFDHAINGFVLRQDGGYAFITEQLVSAAELRKLIENAGAYDPIGNGFNISTYTPYMPDLSNGDRTAFQNFISSQTGGSGSIGSLEIPGITNPLNDFGNIQWTEWEQNGFGTLDEFIDWLLQQNGQKIRVDLDGGFIDFPDMQTRYQMLDQYLNATSSTDTIKMQYIQEYRIENTAHNTIYRMVGQNGINSYTWNFENESTGESYSRYDQLPAIYHQFMRAGTYQIDVRKDVYKTYCSAFTFSLNEYWIVEETGQVVWKREVSGKDIDPTVPAVELRHRQPQGRTTSGCPTPLH